MASHGKHEQITAAEFAQRSQEAYGENSRVNGPSASELSRANALAHYANAKRKRPRRGLRIAFITVLAVLVGTAALAAAYIMNINSNLSAGVNDTLRSVLTDTSNDEPFYMLLLGVDKDTERAEGSEYGEDSSNYRTDTIILARIDPKNTKVTLVSIHRDTLVDLGEHGKQKINAAYSVGGAAYTVQVVEKFSGVKISHYAEIDMDGFAAIVDAMGGVTVDLPIPVKDPYYTGLDLPAGVQTLDGHTAGLLGRSRHAYDDYGDGDHYRAANQRMLIGEVAKKLLSSDPITLANSVTTLSSYVTTDMDVSSIVALATKFIGMNVDQDLYSGMAPTTSTYTNETWYELCDTSAWRAMMQRVNQGLPPYESEDQDDTAGIAGSTGVSSNTNAVATTTGTTTGQEEAVTPVMSGNVSVLNGSGVQGVAGGVANRLISAGFDASANNADAQSQTIVVYNGSEQAKALGVAQTLGLDASKVMANDGSWSTVTDVVVVIGADWQG